MFDRRSLLKAASLGLLARSASTATAETREAPGPESSDAGTVRVYARSGRMLAEGKVTVSRGGPEELRFRAEGSVLYSGTADRYVWSDPGGAVLVGDEVSAEPGRLVRWGGKEWRAGDRFAVDLPVGGISQDPVQRSALRLVSTFGGRFGLF